MNIYLHELKIKLKSVLTWSLSLTALLFLFMSISSTFTKDTALMTDALSKFPRELLVAFGMENLNMSTIQGFFGFIFLFCQVCLAIQAANYGFGLVSIEETELTADFLLAKPVSRASIMTSKLLAVFTALTVTNLVVWGITFLTMGLFAKNEQWSAGTLVTLLLTIVVFQLFFLLVGLAISLFVKKVRSVTPYSMGLVFGLYILNAFGNMIGEKSLEIISPFQHFEPNYIITNNAWNWSLVPISIAFIVVCLPLSYFLYIRRNIASAN
jgi:ABC-2 type transport system permease protein